MSMFPREIPPMSEAIKKILTTPFRHGPCAGEPAPPANVSERPKCLPDCSKWEGGHRPGCPNDDWLWSAGSGPVDHESATKHAEYRIHTGSIEGMTKGEAFHEKRNVNLARAYLALKAQNAALEAERDHLQSMLKWEPADDRNMSLMVENAALTAELERLRDLIVQECDEDTEYDCESYCVGPRITHEEARAIRAAREAGKA